MRLGLLLTIFSVVCLAASCSSAQEPLVVKQIVNETAQQTKLAELTEDQAIALAEKFIAQNGYTDLAPDKENLTFESIEWEGNTDDILKIRHDTLEKRAFGVIRRRKGGDPGWTVAFKYKNSSDHAARKNGRAVTLDPDGSNGHVEHVDIILAKVDKKL